MKEHKSTTHKIGGQFAPRLSEMLRSPAMRALSLSARRILDRIEIELSNHGGKDNGRLPVTYQNLKDFGICNRSDIARGKRELSALGLVECTKGHGGNGEFRRPTLFRLTYLPAHGKGPTHEWRQFETVEEAEKVAKKVRRRTNEKNKTPVTENVTRSSRKTRLSPVTENVTMPRKHRSRFPRRLSILSSHLPEQCSRGRAPGSKTQPVSHPNRNHRRRKERQPRTAVRGFVNRTNQKGGHHGESK